MLPFLGGSFQGAASTNAPSGAAMTLSGSLSATASSDTITSVARTVTVPAGNSGVIRFEDFVFLGANPEPLFTMLARKNSESYVSASEGSEMTFANGDTITLTVTGAGGTGDGLQCRLIDATNGSQIATHGQPQLYRV